MDSLDFSALTDDQLVGLIRAALQEVVRRGPAVEAAARSAGLDEAEKARIAKDAAEKEARRLHQDEAARIAAAAAAKVRQEAEAKAVAKTAKLWERKKQDALTVRKFLGYKRDFHFCVWKKDADQRVYIRKSDGKFGDNVVEYFHTGNGRNQPGALLVGKAWIEQYVAARGGDKETFLADFKAALVDICGYWNSVDFDVDEELAPTPPENFKTSYTLSWVRPGGKDPVYAGDENNSAHANRYLSHKDNSTRWATAEEALSHASEYACAVTGISPEAIAVKERTF